jgi:hypothetical protein
VVRLRAVVEAIVALFEDGSHHAVVGTPAGVVVDLGPGSWGPDEDLQRVRVILAVAAIGHVPVIGLSRLLWEGKNVRV